MLRCTHSSTSEGPSSQDLLALTEKRQACDRKSRIILVITPVSGIIHILPHLQNLNCEPKYLSNKGMALASNKTEHQTLQPVYVLHALRNFFLAIWNGGKDPSGSPYKTPTNTCVSILFHISLAIACTLNRR